MKKDAETRIQSTTANRPPLYLTEFAVPLHLIRSSRPPVLASAASASPAAVDRRYDTTTLYLSCLGRSNYAPRASVPRFPRVSLSKGVYGKVPGALVRVGRKIEKARWEATGSRGRQRISKCAGPSKHETEGMRLTLK
jgi:hypothetical protein